MNKLILSSCLMTALFSNSLYAQAPNLNDPLSLPQSTSAANKANAPVVTPTSEYTFDSNGFLIDPNNPKPNVIAQSQPQQMPQGYSQQMPQQMPQGYPQQPYGPTAYGPAPYGPAQPQYQPNPYQQAYPQAVNAPPMAPPSNLPPLPSDFELGVEKNLGMTPSEIRTLRSLLDDRQKAAAELPNPPKSVTGSVNVSLDPGSTPPVVRPFFGVSTSIVILDSTGAAWPVENFVLGNKALFSIERLDGAIGSTFIITPSQTYGQSNLILKLAGLSTPVVINLVSGQKVHDARVEARVLGRGPNAQIASQQLTAGVDSRLLSVLDGVPPQGRSVNVSGDDSSKAWVMPDGAIWLRTNVQVIAPAPISFASASDGTTVYRLAPASSVLGKINGQYITLSLDGCLQECSNSSGQGW